MGERAKSIGDEAEDKVWNFLSALQYAIRETNNEEYDIDCIADPPPKTIKYGLIKPCYAPDGLTAFEVTVETLRKTKVSKFEEKIRRYNCDNPQQKITGGILIVDQRISLSMLRFMENHRVWGWGIGRQRLYQEKIKTYNYWKNEGFTTEIFIDTNASYLRCSTPPPTKSEQLLHFAVFFDDDFHKLSSTRVREVMNKIKEDSISPLMDLGIRPVNAFFDFYSIGGLSEHLREEIWKTVIEPWKTEGILVFTNSKPFKDYRTFGALDVE